MGQKKMEVHITCTSILPKLFFYIYSMKRNFSNSFVLLELIFFEVIDIVETTAI